MSRYATSRGHRLFRATFLSDNRPNLPIPRGMDGGRHYGHEHETRESEPR